jgi:hypothetical protein
LAPAQKLTDVYLRNRDDNLGLKLREGRLEIKWRRNFNRFVGAGGRVQGQAEDWSKWVWTDTSANTARQIEDSIRHDSQTPWIEVAKERLQIKHAFVGSRFSAATLDDHVEQGCTIELTKVGVHDQWWWTVALDVFGQRGEAAIILHQRAETLFTDYPGPDLRLENSYSYPQWLSSIG